MINKTLWTIFAKKYVTTPIISSIFVSYNLFGFIRHKRGNMSLKWLELTEVKQSPLWQSSLQPCLTAYRTVKAFPFINLHKLLLIEFENYQRFKKS
jgi:hypothetical protein